MRLHTFLLHRLSAKIRFWRQNAKCLDLWFGLYTCAFNHLSYPALRWCSQIANWRDYLVRPPSKGLVAESASTYSHKSRFLFRSSQRFLYHFQNRFKKFSFYLYLFDKVLILLNIHSPYLLLLIPYNMIMNENGSSLKWHPQCLWFSLSSEIWRWQLY